MKKLLLTLSAAAFVSASTFAQSKSLNAAPAEDVSSTSQETTTTVQFVSETYDFGALKEGDKAEATFTFRNTGKEPLIIKNVKPQCGCTVPSYSKDAIAPGSEGSITATYRTTPGIINKSITVISNAGTNTLWLKGNVEKAPTSSVPANNTSMIKK